MGAAALGMNEDHYGEASGEEESQKETQHPGKERVRRQEDEKLQEAVSTVTAPPEGVRGWGDHSHQQGG